MTKTILIVENISTETYEKIINEYPEYKIYCLSYFSHKSLQKNNISHEIGELLLSENDKNIIDQMTLNSTINWYNHEHIQQYLLFENINLGSLIELELLHYFLSLYIYVV